MPGAGDARHLLLDERGAVKSTGRENKGVEIFLTAICPGSDFASVAQPTSQVLALLFAEVRRGQLTSRFGRLHATLLTLDEVTSNAHDGSRVPVGVLSQHTFRPPKRAGAPRTSAVPWNRPSGPGDRWRLDDRNAAETVSSRRARPRQQPLHFSRCPRLTTRRHVAGRLRLGQARRQPLDGPTSRDRYPKRPTPVLATRAAPPPASPHPVPPQRATRPATARRARWRVRSPTAMPRPARPATRCRRRRPARHR